MDNSKNTIKSNPTQISPLARAALTYALDLDLAIFPLKQREKVPATPNGFKDATRDSLTIERWWKQNPNFNVGLATGAVNRLAVLDFDSFDAMTEIEAEFGKLPETPNQITGRGIQFFFRCDEELQSRMALRPKTDFKCAGGYVVVAPSIHPSGKTYQWDGLHHIRDINLAPLPTWLKSLVGIRGARSSGKRSEELIDVINRLPEKIKEGSRNESFARVAGHLLRRYVDEDLVHHILMALNEKYFDPRLPEHEINQVLESIAAKELKRRRQKAEVKA